MPISPEVLLQRQMEASGSFREPIKSPQQLLTTMTTIADLFVFMPTVEELSRVLKIPLENIFQCLMQIGMGGAVGFDQQARQGAVPMHQAKVLDRQTLLAAQQVEPTLRKQVPDDELAKLVSHCQTLRSFLRMKIEDNNDFKMAHRMVSLAHEYLREIYRLADGDTKVMFALYRAESVEDISALTVSSKMGPESPVKLDQTSSSGPAPNKPLPKLLLKGVEEEIQHLATGKEPVPQRQAALETVADWLQRAEQQQLDKCFEELVAVLGPSIKIHLAEKRSTLVRLATSIVTVIAIRSPPQLLMDDVHQSAKVRATISGWLDALFKSVFVTVSAIANAADEAVRDVIVASAGASFVTSKVADALKAAPQPELKRKLLQYVSMVLLAARPCSLSQLRSDLLSFGNILSPLLQSGDAGVRRAARTVTIIAIDYVGLEGCMSRCQAMTDPQVIRAINADKAEILSHASQGLEVFELKWLGCKQPCTASLFWHERCEGVFVGSSAQRRQAQPATRSAPLEIDSKAASRSPSPNPTSSSVPSFSDVKPTTGGKDSSVPGSKADNGMLATEAPLSKAQAVILPSIYANKPQRTSISEGRRTSPSIAGAMPLSLNMSRGSQNNLGGSFVLKEEIPVASLTNSLKARRAAQ